MRKGIKARALPKPDKCITLGASIATSRRRWVAPRKDARDAPEAGVHGPIPELLDVATGMPNLRR